MFIIIVLYIRYRSEWPISRVSSSCKVVIRTLTKQRSRHRGHWPPATFFVLQTERVKSIKLIVCTGGKEGACMEVPPPPGHTTTTTTSPHPPPHHSIPLPLHIIQPPPSHSITSTHATISPLHPTTHHNTKPLHHATHTNTLKPPLYYTTGRMKRERGREREREGECFVSPSQVYQ